MHFPPNEVNRIFNHLHSALIKPFFLGSVKYKKLLTFRNNPPKLNEYSWPNVRNLQRIAKE
jgi:hypothetical protein